MPSFGTIVTVSARVRPLQAQLPDSAAALELAVMSVSSELATDIKQILSVQERREILRGLARQHMDAVMKAGA